MSSQSKMESLQMVSTSVFCAIMFCGYQILIILQFVCENHFWYCVFNCDYYTFQCFIGTISNIETHYLSNFFAIGTNYPYSIDLPFLESTQLINFKGFIEGYGWWLDVIGYLFDSAYDGSS